jgi:hypothetical protein
MVVLALALTLTTEIVCWRSVARRTARLSTRQLVVHQPGSGSLRAVAGDTRLTLQLEDANGTPGVSFTYERPRRPPRQRRMLPGADIKVVGAVAGFGVEGADEAVDARVAPGDAYAWVERSDRGAWLHAGGLGPQLRVSNGSSPGADSHRVALGVDHLDLGTWSDGLVTAIVLPGLRAAVLLVDNDFLPTRKSALSAGPEQSSLQFERDLREQLGLHSGADAGLHTHESPHAPEGAR